MTASVQFVDDQEGYIAWLRGHPSGYVVNCNRSPSAAYLVLHRATCWTISGTQKNWTGGSYIKVCADTLADLDTWGQRETGVYPSRCGTCTP